ncbi:MAG TPA: GNAT family N-acetyltransferase [Gemmatimonadaceae bacterium]|nr:GNAT family N-acetyltransferase [Gemmatimonadaceae bacterium]
MTVRPPSAGDAAAGLALVTAAVDGTPYAPHLLDLAREALTGGSAESRALAAEHAGEMVGVVVFGEVAGAVGAGKVHLAVVTALARLRGVATLLLDAAVAEMAERGARLVIAELPDDPRVAPGAALMRSGGFAEEGRVPDFYADGIALVILVRRLAGG